jgi:hypothetical protein
MDTIVIVLIVVIVLLVYFLYKASKTSSSSSTTLYNLNNTNTAIVNSDLTNPTSYAFSYESWIYVNTWNNTIDKVFYYASPGADTSVKNTLIKLKLDKTTPTLTCKINAAGTDSANPPIIVTNNFPIQKWVYVVISVDSQIVDCYLDGKLIKSTKLPFLPNTSLNYDINFGTCDSYITGFKRNANAVNPQTVWSNYMSGNGYSGNSYGMNVAITKDDVVMSEVSY